MIDYETIRQRYLAGYITDCSLSGSVAPAYKNASGVIVWLDEAGAEHACATQLERYWKLGCIADNQYTGLWYEKHPIEPVAEEV